MKPKPKKKPTNPQYVQFTEDNDWEGETWHFYIPIKGNEEAIERLKSDIARAAASQEHGIAYSVADKKFSLNAIKALIDNDNDECSYMAKHNKLTGYLKMDKLDVIVTDETVQKWEDQFYKGGIADLMTRRKS